MADKVAFIRWLATQVCLEYSTDIEEYVDQQFQPIGNRNISWIDLCSNALHSVADNTDGKDVISEPPT